MAHTITKNPYYNRGSKFYNLVAVNSIRVGPSSAQKEVFDSSGNLTLNDSNYLHMGTFSSTAAGLGINIKPATTAAVRVYCDDGGAALTPSGSVPDLANTKNRYLVTASQTAVHIRLHADMGQIKAVNAAWNTEQVGAQYGYLELVRTSGTMTFGGYGVTAAVLGEIETVGTITVDTNHVIAGVGVISKMGATGTFTQTGKTAAFYAQLYDTTNWSDGSITPDQFGYGLLLDTGACSTGIYMSNTAVGIYSAVTALGAAVDGHDFYVTVSAPNNQYGMSGYFDATINGTTAGNCYGLGSWINTGATSPVLSAGHLIVPLECGIYTGEAQSSARVVLHQLQAILNGAPTSLHVWRVNTTQTITAVIAAANPGSLGYAAGAGTTSTKCGDIPIADIVGTGVVYMRCYNAAG